MCPSGKSAASAAAPQEQALAGPLTCLISILKRSPKVAPAAEGGGGVLLARKAPALIWALSTRARLRAHRLQGFVAWAPSAPLVPAPRWCPCKGHFMNHARAGRQGSEGRKEEANDFLFARRIGSFDPVPPCRRPVFDHLLQITARRKASPCHSPAQSIQHRE